MSAYWIHGLQIHMVTSRVLLYMILYFENCVSMNLVDFGFGFLGF